MQAQILTMTIPIVAIIFCAVFIALWWRGRSHIHVLGYAYWFGAVALGLVLQTFVFGQMGPPEVVIFHLLSSSALITLAWALAKRDGVRAPLAGYIGITLVTAVILWFARMYDEQPILLMVQNFNAGLIFAMTAFTKWQASTKQIADRFLLYTLSGLAIYAFVRPSVTVLIQSQMTMDEYQASAFLTFNLAVTAFCTIFLALSLIATIVADSLEEQRSAATIDLLSGLKVRRAFEEQANEMIARAQRLEKPLCLIVGDLDHFKRINDGWGHATGDMVITKFGEVIANQIRNTDAAGRIGGEEFCIVVWNCQLKPAAALAERLRKSMAASGETGDCASLTITASFGVAQWQPGEPYSAVFERADAALYRAKRRGRNNVMADDQDAAEFVETNEGVITIMG